MAHQADMEPGAFETVMADPGSLEGLAKFDELYGVKVNSIFPNPGGSLASAELADATKEASLREWIGRTTGIGQPG